MKTSLLMWVSLVALMAAGTGCEYAYDVTYTVELKGDACVKFEDAMFDQNPDELVEEWVEDCLGEDGAEEADVFYVELDGVTDEITVSLKAGKCNETVTLAWGDWVWNSEDYGDGLMGTVCGFTVYAYPDGNAYYLIVLSDTNNRTAALSNLTFCFGDGVTVLNPEEGPCTIERYQPEVERE